MPLRLTQGGDELPRSSSAERETRGFRKSFFLSFASWALQGLLHSLAELDLAVAASSPSLTTDPAWSVSEPDPSWLPESGTSSSSSPLLGRPRRTSIPDSSSDTDDSSREASRSFSRARNLTMEGTRMLPMMSWRAVVRGGEKRRCNEKKGRDVSSRDRKRQANDAMERRRRAMHTYDASRGWARCRTPSWDARRRWK